jgi:alkylation response protein AidB-like acyl-CoA dehydrogenase
MTVLDHTPTTAADVLAAVQELRPTITERAAEIEAARRIPSDLLDHLIQAGCFRLLRPRSHGGLGAEFPAAMRVLETLARADGATGWTTMIGAGSWIDLVHLPRATFDSLFDGKPDAIFAGAFNPSGSISPVADGYRVEGRWAFASGCEHADWMFGNCIEGFDENGPVLRGAVFTPDEVTIEDTWYVSGLRGTGSHHFRADGVVVPAERTYLALSEEPCIDDPVVRIPVVSLIALAMAPVATGIALGALDDVVELAATKMPLLAPAPLATNALFHHDLAAAHTELSAVRALLWDLAEEAWATAIAGHEFTMEQRARMRAAAAWAADRSAAVVETAYRFGGGSSLYDDCPLQRRLRDIQALAQHFIVKPDTLTAAGAVLAGQEPQVMVF